MSERAETAGGKDAAAVVADKTAGLDSVPDRAAVPREGPTGPGRI